MGRIMHEFHKCLSRPLQVGPYTRGRESPSVLDRRRPSVDMATVSGLSRQTVRRIQVFLHENDYKPYSVQAGGFHPSTTDSLMRLILLDMPGERRMNFDPLALSRPIWDLRCGITSLGEKLIQRTAPADVACFLPSYMADAYRELTDRPVNDAAQLKGDDVLVVDARVRATSLDVGDVPVGSVVLDDDGNLLVARVSTATDSSVRVNDVTEYV